MIWFIMIKLINIYLFHVLQIYIVSQLVVLLLTMKPTIILHSHDFITHS